jgi:hypothetical protein
MHGVADTFRSAGGGDYQVSVKQRWLRRPSA